MLANSCKFPFLEEDPKNSSFFLPDEHARLLQIGWVDVVFSIVPCPDLDRCAQYGQGLSQTSPNYNPWQGPCAQGHVHLPWGKSASGEFNSAVEDDYPVEMCESIIAVFKEVLESRATKFPNIVYAQKNDAWHAP